MQQSPQSTASILATLIQRQAALRKSADVQSLTQFMSGSRQRQRSRGSTQDPPPHIGNERGRKRERASEKESEREEGRARRRASEKEAE
eukprot:3774070-Pleurochrysis_carterae.AAC.1